MKLSIVTTNHDKFDEISNVLKKFKIEAKHVEIELEEKQDNIEEIVQSKAKQAFEKINGPILVDDTGIFFEAYDNYPGHKAKRVYQELGYDVLKKLDGKDRGMFFKSIICFKDEKETKTFSGILRGTATKYVQGKPRKQFPYEAIFIPENFSVTLSELPWEQRLNLSHRSKATKKFAKWFVNRQK